MKLENIKKRKKIMENSKTKWRDMQEEQGLDPDRHNSLWCHYSGMPSPLAYSINDTIISDPGDEHEFIIKKKS